MRIAVVSGFELLEQHYTELVGGTYKVVVFVLAGGNERGLLYEVVDMASDLNHVSGPSCLVVAFLPETEEHAVWPLRNWQPGALPQKDAPGWSAFADAMTNSSYAIARFFGIPFKELPCLLFLTEESEYGVLSLQGDSLSGVYRRIREVFSDWYATNRNDEAERLRSLAMFSVRRKPRKAKARADVENALRTVVLPVIRRAIEDAVSSSTKRTRVFMAGRLNGLHASPFTTMPIRDLLRRRNITATVDDLVFDDKNFDTSYEQLYDRLVGSPSRRELMLCREPAPFPLNRIRRLNSRVAVGRAFGRVGRGIQTMEKGLGWVAGLRKLIGLP